MSTSNCCATLPGPVRSCQGGVPRMCLTRCCILVFELNFTVRAWVEHLENRDTTEDITFALVGALEWQECPRYNHSQETKRHAKTAVDMLERIKFLSDSPALSKMCHLCIFWLRFKPGSAAAGAIRKILIKILQYCCADRISMGFMLGWMVVKDLEVEAAGGLAVPKHVGMSYDFGPAYINVCSCIELAVRQMESAKVGQAHTHAQSATHALSLPLGSEANCQSLGPEHCCLRGVRASHMASSPRLRPIHEGQRVHE